MPSPGSKSSFDRDVPADLRERFIAHTQVLLKSYQALLEKPLFVRSGDALEDARRVFDAPFAVLSHAVQADPVLNYGNHVVLSLWEMTLPQLLATPSRQTAEPMLHEARDKLLAETRAKGFISGYSGVRISATGRRFRIENVTIWNVVDGLGKPAGQAATFDTWTPV
jgi:hypothetical protein